jgi:hypothetical protein
MFKKYYFNQLFIVFANSVWFKRKSLPLRCDRLSNKSYELLTLLKVV